MSDQFEQHNVTTRADFASELPAIIDHYCDIESKSLAEEETSNLPEYPLTDEYTRLDADLRNQLREECMAGRTELFDQLAADSRVAPRYLALRALGELAEVNQDTAILLLARNWAYLATAKGLVAGHELEGDAELLSSMARDVAVHCAVQNRVAAGAIIDAVKVLDSSHL